MEHNWTILNILIFLRYSMYVVVTLMSLSKSCRHKHNISIPHQDTSSETYGFGWITGKVPLCWLNGWKSISLLTGGGSSEAPMCLNSLPRQAPRHGKCFCQDIFVYLYQTSTKGVMPKFWSISRENMFAEVGFVKLRELHVFSILGMSAGCFPQPFPAFSTHQP